jgi:hypothetical protein
MLAMSLFMMFDLGYRSLVSVEAAGAFLQRYDRKAGIHGDAWAL